jgi:hypothetical protein
MLRVRSYIKKYIYSLFAKEYVPKGMSLIKKSKIKFTPKLKKKDMNGRYIHVQKLFGSVEPLVTAFMRSYWVGIGRPSSSSSQLTNRSLGRKKMTPPF